MIRGHNGKGRTLSTHALLITLLLSAILPAKTARAQETPPIHTVQECEQVEEARLRDELNAITQSVFEADLSVAAIVDRNWAALNVDATIDAAVDAAIERVRNEEGYWSRFMSNWSPEKAEELTTKVANYTFGSPRFQDAVDQLSTAIASELTAEIRMMTAKSASSALLCVQEFIGATFSQTIASALDEQIQSKLDEMRIDPDAEDANFLAILKLHPELVGGVGVIIGSQIAKRLAQKIAQSLAGKVLARILGKVATIGIPLVGWIIGGGLIIWDLIKGGEGALPQIRKSLQGEDVKAEIRAQIAKEVDEELQTELPQLARSVANDVFSRWRDFLLKFARVLDLAQTNPRFQTILNNTTTDQVDKLSELVALADETLEPERLGRIIDTGQFERIFYLPQPAFEILRVSDPEVVIAWADLAGEAIVEVVETELYRVASPSAFRDREALERVLALQDPEAIQQWMLLNQEERDLLLGLPTAQIRQVIAALSAEDLSWLAAYLTELPPDDTNLLVDRILREPRLMPQLKFENIRQAVLESQNLQATLDLLVEEKAQVLADIGPVLSGDVPWALFWHKYGTASNMLYVSSGLLIVLLILYLLGRNIFRRR